MKYLSLFSGYGGFELGIQQAYERTIDEVEQRRCGQEKGKLEATLPLPSGEPLLGQYPTCIGFSEIDKYAIQVYKKHFGNQQSTEVKQDGERGNGTIDETESNVLPTSGTTTLCNEIKRHKNYGDITKLDPTTLPDFDLLCGGFPCQAFSIAGKRAGFQDTRGTLIYDVFRIIKEKHPRIVLLENVKGLLSHDGGRTFKTIVTSLAELGYAVEWQIINAKNYGVPQNRERVFIVGHLGGFSGRQVFPIGQDSGETIECGVNTGTLTSRYPMSQREGTYIEENGDGVGEIIQINQPKHSNDRFYDSTGISPTLNTMQGGRRQPFIDEKPRIRKLTPKECSRLMGLPDDWLDGVSDSQKYKLAGNGVVVNVVEEIIKRLDK